MEINEKLIKTMMKASAVLYVISMFLPAIYFNKTEVVWGWQCLIFGIKSYYITDPWYVFYGWLAHPLFFAGFGLLYMSMRTGKMVWAELSKLCTMTGLVFGAFMFIPFSHGVEYELGVFYHDTSLSYGSLLWGIALVTLCLASAFRWYQLGVLNKKKQQ